MAVDPRMRARRVAVVRGAGRRRLRRLVGLGVVAGLALVALALTWTPVLDIERIAVDGTRRTPADAVTAAAGLRAGDPLVWFDPAAAEAAVAALPWVATVEVRRSWRGSVTVAVTERSAVAALATGDGTWLLADATGRVLATTNHLPTQVTLVDGVTASAEPGATLDEEVQAALAVAGAVPPSLRPEVGSVQGSGADVDVLLRAGGVITLGDAVDAEAKLAAAAAVLGSVPPACVERLDVTIASSPALVRVPGCA